VSWFLFALAAALASALNVWASKLLVGRAPPEQIATVVHLLGGALAVAALPLVGVGLGEAFAAVPTMLLPLLWMGAVVAAGNLAYFRALAQSELSEIDIFLRSSALWTMLLGVALLAERPPPLAALGGALILLSLAVVAQRPRRWRLLLPQLLALAAALLFGLGNVIDKGISGPFHPLAYSALHLLLGGLWMLPFARIEAWRLRDASVRRVLFGRGAWLVAATFALTQGSLIAAYAAGGRAGDVILVAQLRLVLLLLVGVLLLRERTRLGPKVAASLLMLAGVLILARGG
jgi:drug/metabolite transporter (DMT)-like permease